MFYYSTKSSIDGIAVVDEKYSILNLSEQTPVSSSSALFTNRATYILLAVDSKLPYQLS